jgi:hypothetical protein
MAVEKHKISEFELIQRWFWFFVLYFIFIILIACFGLVAEF